MNGIELKKKKNNKKKNQHQQKRRLSGLATRFLSHRPSRMISRFSDKVMKKYDAEQVGRIIINQNTTLCVCEKKKKKNFAIGE